MTAIESTETARSSRLRAAASRNVEIEVLRRGWSREREARGRESQRMRALMDLLPLPVLVLDSDSTVIDASAAALSLYGEDLIGGRWQGHPHGRQTDLGDESLVIIDPSPARDQRLQMLGASQAALAHQIRTPLTVAGLSVEQVLSTAKDDAVHANLARVQRSLTAIERHISNALVFVRGELSERTSFSLLDLSCALQETWRPLLGDVENWWRSDADLRRCTSGDLSALVSALTNVVDNALAVGGRHTKVVVSLATDDVHARLSIADDGPGMSPRMLARAREPFVSDRPGGTGLGLAIADAVVSAHGGELAIESAPQRGTCVTATLPLLSEASA